MPAARRRRANVVRSRGIWRGRRRTNESTSRRVADIAVVVVSPDGRIAGTGRTNENGEFAIKLPKGGRYLLRALRMGYRPTELAFGIDDTTSVRVEFELSGINAASPQLMAPVVVRGRSVDIPARLLEVYARARHNYGSVFTRGDFALTNNFTFALGTIPGVRVNARGQILFATCDRVQVYINGTRYWTPGDSPTRVLQLVAPADVELMEVYTHVTRLPVEYLNDACSHCRVDESKMYSHVSPRSIPGEGCCSRCRSPDSL